jgi:thiamine-phosphate pyrophosphorylase
VSTGADPRGWWLYVPTDAKRSRGRPHVEVARDAIAGGADVVQLREKEAAGRAFLEAAQEIRRLTREANVPFIVNDRVDVALAVDADGVHVGQDDLPAAVARRLIGNERLVGVSARSMEEAQRAERDGADYIGFGPIYEARGTKPDTIDPLGLERLREVCRTSTVPVIAIGGINDGNVEEVIAAGADGVAVISGVVSAMDVVEVTRRLKSLIRKAKERGR